MTFISAHTRCVVVFSFLRVIHFFLNLFARIFMDFHISLSPCVCVLYFVIRLIFMAYTRRVFFSIHIHTWLSRRLHCIYVDILFLLEHRLQFIRIGCRFLLQFSHHLMFFVSISHTLTSGFTQFSTHTPLYAYM